MIYFPSFLRHLSNQQGVTPGSVVTRGMGRGEKGQEVSREKGGTEGKEQRGTERQITEGWIVRRREYVIIISNILTTSALPGFTTLGQKEAAGNPNSIWCVWDK